ncbi:metallophosphoesterase [Segatella copri]|uniref:metallophosphoesterase n=1 Tax=Segatella copri TaxID=165179 RepID=UPI00345FBE1F
MSMKILATSDWHLGNLFHGNDRLPEHKHFLKWLLEQIAEQKPDALLIAGDIFITEIHRQRHRPFITSFLPMLPNCARTCRSSLPPATTIPPADWRLPVRCSPDTTWK